MVGIREEVEKAVIEAGKLFIDTTLDKSLIEKKGFANYVTEVDYKVQKFLLSKLDEIIPGSNVITEESQENLYNLDKPTWIVDPVDGTTNLMYSYQHSAISIGLYVDNGPYMGFIYNPFMKEMFFAENRKGAYLNGKRIKVTDNSALEDCLVGFGTTPYDRSKAEATFKLVKDMFMKCRDVRRSGSAALDIAYVASGRLDGFFELTLQPWDYAAGIIILSEAGGVTTDWEGNSPKVILPSSIVCTNGQVHKEFLDMIKN